MRTAARLNDAELDMVAGGRGGRRVGLGTLIKLILRLFETQDDNKRKNDN